MSCDGCFCKHARNLHRALTDVEADDVVEAFANIERQKQAQEIMARMAVPAFLMPIEKPAPVLQLVKTEEQN